LHRHSCNQALCCRNLFLKRFNLCLLRAQLHLLLLLHLLSLQYFGG
jgi:hypothetical protein